MNKRTQLALAAGLATGLTAGPAAAGDYFTLLFGYKLSLTGRDLNGTALNGDSLDGRTVAYASLDGFTLGGEPLVDVRLEATQFDARTARGRRVRGERIAGAELVAHLEGGGTLALRIDAVQRGRARADRDVFRYAVSYATAEGWRPLCGTDEAGEPVLALALRGRWDEASGDKIDDPAAFTFACDGFVLAHCVDAGYAPWREAMICHRGPGRCQRTTLAAHHQACTRMMRADYCGDGSTHTTDGTPVNAYDGLGVRNDSEDWLFEAEWDEHGARCMSEERIPGRTPPCMADLVDPDCGDPAHLSEGALIFSEVEPSP